MKVKLRINSNGLFDIASATLVEKLSNVDESSKSDGDNAEPSKETVEGETSMEWESSKAGMIL